LIQKKPFESLVETVGSPYGLLLLVLFSILALYPFLGYFPILKWVLNLVMLAIVFAALRLTQSKNAVHYLTLVLGRASFSADLASHALGVAIAYPLAAVIRTLFMAHLIIAIFIDIMQRKQVTIDAVLGACCIFIMLGLTFGSTFILVEWRAPGSFTFPEAIKSAGGVFHNTTVEFELIYFSLVTMTTIGYGDIYPLTPPARSLAALEGLLSQLYLAIIIARLVGLEIADRLQKSRAGGE